MKRPSSRSCGERRDATPRERSRPAVRACPRGRRSRRRLRDVQRHAEAQNVRRPFLGRAFVATASMLVTGLAMGPSKDEKYATGMIAGAVALVVYALTAALLA